MQTAEQNDKNTMRSIFLLGIGIAFLFSCIGRPAFATPTFTEPLITYARTTPSQSVLLLTAPSNSTSNHRTPWGILVDEQTSEDTNEEPTVHQQSNKKAHAQFSGDSSLAAIPGRHPSSVPLYILFEVFRH